ncbi:hypothetical protein SY88_07115 [Clostridiales bacterium PH28_bin88]|nr:hypothetical protein SY88_07115 [Clostridiales bacterium PH28_bin88]
MFIDLYAKFSGGESVDDLERLQTIVRVARLYYEVGHTQDEIAKEMKISRPQVSRFLSYAKEHGIVQIAINDPLSSCSRLESLFQEVYNLKRAMIVPVGSDDEKMIKQQLGRIAAGFLHRILKDGDIIGISWGTTLKEVALSLKPKNLKEAAVVQLKGSVGRLNAKINPMDILVQFASKLNANPFSLTVPTIVTNEKIKEALVADAMVQEILELGRKANVAVFSIGYPSKKSVLVDAGYFSDEEIENFRQQGAVGDICSRYFTINGEVFGNLDARTIGIELQEIRKKEYAIGIAGGINCASGILGALRGKYLNVLVTDETTARMVIKLAGLTEKEV